MALVELAMARLTTSPPGPRPTPVLGTRGNLLAFMRDPIGYMGDLHRTFGDVASLASGSTDYVFVFSPEYNQHVLNDTALFFNLGAESSPLRIPKGSALARLFAGLTQMNGQKHRAHRAQIAPALHKRYIEASHGDMVAITEQMLAGWHVGQQRDLFKDMRELSLAIAVKTFVGLDLGAGGLAMCRLLERWIGLVFSLSSILLPLDIPGFSYRQLLAASEELEGLIRQLIDLRRAKGGDGRDVLSRLVRLHDEDESEFSDEDLIGHTNFLFMAGHATTASALTWTLFLLSQHPGAMRGVLEELENQRVGSAPTWEQLEDMPFLEAVVKESLRLLPPVMWWSRVSTAPFTLGSYALPIGTRIVHSAYITHRNAGQYFQPNKFMPDRWLASPPGPFEYLPFSAGPRMCLGSSFAMTELKVVLATILQRYQLAVPAGSTVDLGGPMLAEPKKGLPVIIHPRHSPPTRTGIGGNIHRVVDLS